MPSKLIGRAGGSGSSNDTARPEALYPHASSSQPRGRQRCSSVRLASSSEYTVPDELVSFSVRNVSETFVRSGSDARRGIENRPRTLARFRSTRAPSPRAMPRPRKLRSRRSAATPTEPRSSSSAASYSWDNAMPYRRRYLRASCTSTTASTATVSLEDMDGTGSNRTAAARKVPRPYKRRSVSAASDCPAASPDVIVTARSTIESLVLCAPSTRTPRTTYSGPSVTVKLRSTRPSRAATRVVASTRASR